MSIMLDSAIIAEARSAAKLGWVHGLTTNPILLAKSDRSPVETLQELAQVLNGPVFYQLLAQDLTNLQAEAAVARQILGRRLVLKIPATPYGFQAAAQLSRLFACALTAVYSPAQAVVAAAAGAQYVIPYVNRATRLMGDGIKLVREIASVLPSGVEILAASIKDPAEAVATLEAGAHHLTLPLAVLLALMEHELSAQAVAEFAQFGKGLAAPNPL